MYIVVEPCLGDKGQWNVRIEDPVQDLGGACGEPIWRVPDLVARCMDRFGHRKNNGRIPEIDTETSQTDNCVVIEPDLKTDMWFVFNPDGTRLLTSDYLISLLPELMNSLGTNRGNTVEVKEGVG